MILHSKGNLYCVLKRWVVVKLVGSIQLSEACVHHWRSMKTKLFSCLTIRKSLSGPRKGRKIKKNGGKLCRRPKLTLSCSAKGKEGRTGRNPEIDTSIL
jgi:hypothetical protein